MRHARNGVGIARAIACLTLAALVAPRAASAQDERRPVSDGPSPSAWTMAGVDLGLHEQWRVMVRAGYLSDIDSRLLLTDVAFVVGPAVQALAGYVHVDPATPRAAGTTLVRAGAAWLPLRGRVALDNRFLVEHRSTGAIDVMRGRGRLRLFWTPPGPLDVVAYGSGETIVAFGDGLAENRFQAGGVKSAGRFVLDVYWLHRRLRARPVVNGIGVTAVYRVGR